MKAECDVLNWKLPLSEFSTVHRPQSLCIHSTNIVTNTSTCEIHPDQNLFAKMVTVTTIPTIYTCCHNAVSQ